MAFFPNSVLTYTPFSDLSPSEATDAARWHTLKIKATKTAAEIEEFNSLTASLSTKIFSAGTFNSLFDEIIALEEFFNSTVSTYVDGLASDFSNLGEWSAGVAYKLKNIVTKYGCSYMCVKACTGVAPVERAHSTYWRYLATKGDQGASGTGLSPRGVWSAIESYVADDCVSYNNILWRCLVANSDSVPTTSSIYWEKMLECPSVETQEVWAAKCDAFLFKNISVPVTSWSADSTYSGTYPYRAEIVCTGVVATDYPIVTFAIAEATGGKMASIALCGSGVVYIYASSIPTSAITIRSVVCLRIPNNSLSVCGTTNATPESGGFYAGSSAPSNTKLLWIDTTAITGGLKYYNGSAWVGVPVQYT